MHEHYDAEDNLTGYTVVTREAEWSDVERGKMLDLAEYEAGIHVDGCGYHSTVANDRGNYFTVESETCPLCAQLARKQRIQQAAETEAEKKAQPSTPRPGDGRRTYLRPLTPEEVETAKAAQRAAREGVRRGNTP